MFAKFTSQLTSLDRGRVVRLSKEGGWIAGGQVVTIIGSLVLVRVLTEFLTPVQYGQLALGLTLAVLVNQIVLGGIGGGIGRFFVIAAERQDLARYLASSWQLLGYASLCVLAIAAVLIVGLISVGQAQWVWLSAASLLFALISGLNATMNSIQNAARQRQIVAFHGGLDAWLKIALAVGVMHLFGASSTAVVIGYSLSALLVTGSQLVFLRRLIYEPSTVRQAAGNENWMLQIWQYSWPFSTWGVFTWAQQSSDRWSLEAYGTTAGVGAYAVLTQLGYAPISTASAFVLSFLAPILYQRAGDGTVAERTEAVHRLSWIITLFCLALTAMAVLIALLFHGWIFRVLVAAPYRVASPWLAWMVLSGGLFAAGQVLATKLMADMRTSLTIPVKIGTAILGVILNVCGAAIFGLPGVVSAMVIFSVVYLLWISWLCWRPPGVLGARSSSQCECAK